MLNSIIYVESSEYVSGYKLRIVFSDGKSRIVDFGPFLKTSQNPSIQAYLKPKRFKKFVVRDGDLMWGDFDLIFPVANLYQGRI